MWHFKSELGFIARRSKSLKKRGTQRGILNLFLWVAVHGLHLPEAHTYMRGQKSERQKTM